MAAAAVVNITINRGATFTQGFILKKATGVPFDLTGYTAKSQIRKTPENPTVEAEVTVTFDQNRKSGKITLQLSDTQTKTLPSIDCVYDVKLSDPTLTVVSRIIQGAVTVSPDVTR